MYEIAAKHLKSCFPNLKIGGPAISGYLCWAEDFLCEMQKRKVPLDFFSWHIYCTEPQEVIERAEIVNSLLIKYGYENSESILNEWNYIKGWTDEFVYSIKSLTGLKGASFIMANICSAQHSPIDMLMYYDTRPSAFNGIFDFYTYEPLKGYYALYWYGMFYSMEKEIPSENSIENIYSLCGVDNQGKALAVLTYYSDDDNAENKTVNVDLGKDGNYEIYVVDDTHNGELIKTTDKLQFDMKIHNMILIKEI